MQITRVIVGIKQNSFAIDTCRVRLTKFSTDTSFQHSDQLLWIFITAFDPRGFIFMKFLMVLQLGGMTSKTINQESIDDVALILFNKIKKDDIIWG